MSHPLITAIRKNDYKAVENLLKTEEGQDSLNQFFPVEACDIEHINLKLLDYDPRYRVPLSEPCTPAFFTAYYGNYDIYKLLVDHGGRLGLQSESKLSQAHRFLVIGMNRFAEDASCTDYVMGYNEQTAVGVQPSSNFISKTTIDDEEYVFYGFEQDDPSNELETLVKAAKKNALGKLNECIEQGTLAIDTKGSALYYALYHGHEAVVRRLKEAGSPITPRHYYAAGRGPVNISTSLYYLIRPTIYTRIETPMLKIQTDLYHAIYKNEILNVYRLLRDNADLAIEPKHYYACGRAFYQADASASKLYNLMKFFDEHKKLPDSFLTDREKAELDNLAKPKVKLG